MKALLSVALVLLVAIVWLWLVWTAGIDDDGVL